MRRVVGWLSGRLAAVLAGPATWFGAGLAVAAGCTLAYTLVLAPPATARLALPPRPASVTALPAVASPAPDARGAPPPARAAPTAPPASCPPPAGVARVNINTASVADLQALPGIGPAAAQRIVDERQQAPFTSVDELHDRHIVSALTLGRIRGLVVVQ